MLGYVWGLFRKRQSTEHAQREAVDESRVQPTEELDIDRDSEDRDLVDGVEIGEHPGEWVDRAIAARATREEDSAFAPPENGDEAGTASDDEVASDEATAGDETAPDETPADGDTAQLNQEAPHQEASNQHAARVEMPEHPDDPVALSSAEFEEVKERWLAELAKTGGISTLTRFRGERGTYIDLTTAHPSGVATLLAGRPVMLTSLLREPLAFRNALDAADHVARKGAELESARGLSCVQLAIGLASWTSETGQMRSPVLLRAATLQRLGRDYELRLRGRTHPNVALLRALYDDGVTLRASELNDAVGDSGSLLPEAVFELVRERGASLPDFYVDARAFLSTFGDVAEQLVADATELDHPMLQALAGDEQAQIRLGGDLRVETSIDPDLRDPAADRPVSYTHLRAHETTE